MISACKLLISNTFRMKNLIFFNFSLTVPPTIDDSLSSSDVIVREGSNITLKCRAHGSPTPTIKWKRDDNSKININKSLSGELKCRGNLSISCNRNFLFSHFDSLWMGCWNVGNNANITSRYGSIPLYSKEHSTTERVQAY